jgi:hypothetical protein
MLNVTIHGNYGTLTVHVSTGIVVSYDPEGNEPEYADIKRFDPADLARCPGGGDILFFGFWDDQGRYFGAITPRIMTGRRPYYRCIPSYPAYIFVDNDLDEMVPMAYLPAHACFEGAAMQEPKP